MSDESDGGHIFGPEYASELVVRVFKGSKWLLSPLPNNGCWLPMEECAEATFGNSYDARIVHWRMWYRETLAIRAIMADSLEDYVVDAHRDVTDILLDFRAAINNLANLFGTLRENENVQK